MTDFDPLCVKKAVAWVNNASEDLSKVSLIITSLRYRQFVFHMNHHFYGYLLNFQNYL